MKRWTPGPEEEHRVRVSTGNVSLEVTAMGDGMRSLPTLSGPGHSMNEGILSH